VSTLTGAPQRLVRAPRASHSVAGFDDEIECTPLNSVRSSVRASKTRHQVADKVAAVVLNRGALALLDLGEVLDVAVARLGDRLALGPPGHHNLLLYAQLGLRLRAREAVARAGYATRIITFVVCPFGDAVGFGPAMKRCGAWLRGLCIVREVVGEVAGELGKRGW
jgi:hypothetical protein